MSKSLPIPRLYKSIFQVRYKPELRFYEHMYEAAQKVNWMPDWETDRLKVTVSDSESHCSITIAHDSFTYAQDSSDIQLEGKNINSILNILPEALQLKSFGRFGFRQWYLIPVTYSFEELASILEVKLFSQDEKLRAILPKDFQDLMYVVIRDEGKFRAKITIGPVKKSEAAPLIPYDKQYHLGAENREERYRSIVAEYPEVAVFLDIDYFQLDTANKLQVQEAAVFYSTAARRIAQMAKDLCEYFFSTKLKF